MQTHIFSLLFPPIDYHRPTPSYFICESNGSHWQNLIAYFQWIFYVGFWTRSRMLSSRKPPLRLHVFIPPCKWQLLSSNVNTEIWIWGINSTFIVTLIDLLHRAFCLLTPFSCVIHNFPSLAVTQISMITAENDNEYCAIKFYFRKVLCLSKSRNENSCKHQVSIYNFFTRNSLEPRIII